MSKTRQGKHKAGKVRMGCYVEPFRKAVATYMAKHLHMTMTDIIWIGIENVARSHGVLKSDGSVADEFKPEIEAETEIVCQSEVNG
jgi:hypothetical protein